MASVSGQSATAANYYVATTGSDLNPGTAAKPFKTILHASTVVNPGEVVMVLDGTYIGGFKTSASGTAIARITYKAQNKWGAKLVPPASSASDTAWDNRGAYVTIDGFEVDGTVDPSSGTKWAYGIYNAGEGGILQRNLVHHIYNTGIANSSGGAGLMNDSWYGFNNMQMLNNKVHHVGPATGGSTWYHGIYVTATGAIKGNIAYANAGGGIHMWHDIP